jgi:succinate dehydrogenase / fumarate reductase flavoprotein subunit
VSEAETRAALERHESRGAHTRVEYPDSDPRFATVNVVIRRRGDAMSVVQEPLPRMPDDLRRIVEGEGST